MSMKVSVVGPVRGRYETTVRMINSFVNQAHDINDVEFIFRLDEDDVGTINNLMEYYHDKNLDITFLTGIRHGYLHLNRYWNECINAATGEYVVLASDDNELNPDNKSNWDSVIREFEGQFYILDFPEDISKDRTTLATLPKKLFEIMGNRLSPNLIEDRWLNDIHKKNDIWVVCNDVKHINRDCFTGRSPIDNTFIEGRQHYNSVGLPPEHKKWDISDALKVKEYLKKNPNTKVIRETNKIRFGG